MADEKAIEKDQENISSGAKKDDLSGEDLEKVVGGERDASGPHVSEIVITKLTDAATP